ncbi:transposon I factor [Pochonia chlamydosporia 170]|uniref:Transposon I factor n=1 Tax=Pochonia chlamydosporia 170 TaxID=1380566 RepID=A0A179F1J3_METCM|nr:transposon I factor [Pochonia chlamydosporia 170]OAQ58963.1 transposon I factor [Pochonia chlamydosporia 170]
MPDSAVVEIRQAGRVNPAAPKRSTRLVRPTVKAMEIGRQESRSPTDVVKRTTKRVRRASSTEASLEPAENVGSDETARSQGVEALLLQVLEELKSQNGKQEDLIKELQTQLRELKEHFNHETKETRDELYHTKEALKQGPGTAGDHLEVPCHDLNTIESATVLRRHGTNATNEPAKQYEKESPKVTAGTIRSALQKEIRTTEDNASWRCRAVTVDPKNPNRIKIACRDESEHQMVKQAMETTRLAAGVRVLRDELYPIKVDNVRRTAVLDDGGEVLAGAAETFGQENEAKVAKIAWLSRRDVPKAYGSMVVYLSKGADARRLLAEGFFHAGGESGYTGVFERRPRPEQCYNCQEIGHKAFQCKGKQRCARCAKEGHRHENCHEEIMKCVPCGGPHESFSRHCPKPYPTQKE